MCAEKEKNIREKLNIGERGEETAKMKEKKRRRRELASVRNEKKPKNKKQIKRRNKLDKEKKKETCPVDKRELPTLSRNHAFHSCRIGWRKYKAGLT